MMKLLKEPLLHFLLIGAAFFALYSYLNPQSLQVDNQIVVNEGRINALQEGFRRTWNRLPSDDELQGLIDDYVLEEIYYRQALALGIEQNDAMIRRRLRQKMEFLSASMISELQPSDAQLQAYLQEHAQKYRTSNQYSLQQVYISPDRDRASLSQRIESVRQQLLQDQPVDSDGSLFPQRFEQASDFQLNNQFGRGFAAHLDQLPLNEWSGPVESGLGYHFIQLSERHMGQLPPLDQVRDEVVRDWTYDQQQQIKAQLNEKLLADYQIVVEWPQGADS